MFPSILQADYLHRLYNPDYALAITLLYLQTILSMFQHVWVGFEASHCLFFLIRVVQ